MNVQPRTARRNAKKLRTALVDVKRSALALATCSAPRGAYNDGDVDLRGAVKVLEVEAVRPWRTPHSH